MPDDGRSRLGRGLARSSAMSARRPKQRARARPAPRADRIPQAQSRNPRRNFSEAELDELAASVREHGVIQPIVVRPARGAADAFEIIAGERRWRAAQRAGLRDVPIVALDVSDGEALELAIIENVQRTDLNAIEEAEGYQRLANEFGHGQETLPRSSARAAATWRIRCGC